MDAEEPPPPAPPSAEPPPPPSPPHRVSLSLMVVPEGEPARRAGPQKRSLFFKFTTPRSSGRSTRHPIASPLISDLHVASLHSDKVFAETSLKQLKKAHAELQANYTRVHTDWLHAVRDANKAYDTMDLDSFDMFMRDRDYFSTLQTRINDQRRELGKLEKERDKLLRQRDAAVKTKAAFKAASQTDQRDLKSAMGRLATAEAKAKAAAERVEQSKITVKKMSGQLNELQVELAATNTRVVEVQESCDELQESCDWGAGRVEELEGRLAGVESLLEGLGEMETQLVDEIAKTAPKRGRPTGHRGAGTSSRFGGGEGGGGGDLKVEVSLRVDTRRRAFPSTPSV